jgi:hypothetical protein
VTDERVTQQQAHEALDMAVRSSLARDTLRQFIAQHPDTQGASTEHGQAKAVDTQGEARAWVAVYGLDHACASVYFRREDAERTAHQVKRENGYTYPLYASPPSDSGLRRALLALADEWDVGVFSSVFSKHLRTLLRDFDTPQRELAGHEQAELANLRNREAVAQGTPSVGSSGEVSP